MIEASAESVPKHTPFRTGAYDAAKMAARLFELAVEVDDEPDHPEGPEEVPGDLIGPYRLIQKLGEGGFGIVWRAEQTRPIRRQVAVKILRPGMNSKAVLQRFRAEQRALERMEHPNIAAVLDAGMTGPGRPYVVLELVRGRPITSFCEEAGLTLRDRLTLFMDVCRAVQHAHQRAILHRDLKPSNILVAEAEKPPVPKIIDFGIAKALAEDEDWPDTWSQTVQGMLLGTPQYMAPEQAVLGAQVTDVRVDVYALGAILYELLTGAPPLETGVRRTSSLTGLLARIHDEDAVRPSLRAQSRRAAEKLAPCTPESLRGDLDWIILKALEKKPERRYESANALADDIHRHLTDEPVSAGPPSRWYGFKKLVRRNRLAFAIGTVVALNVILLAVMSTLGFLREAEARTNEELLRRVAEMSAANAATQSKKATALAEFLSRLLQQAGTLIEQGKNPEALRMAVDRSMASVQALNDQPELQAELLGRLAGIYKAMGDSRRALPLYQAQVGICKRLYGENHQRTLSVLLHLAGVTSGVGDKQKSLEIYGDLAQRWLAKGAAGLLPRREALRSYARELSRQKQGPKAIEIMRLTLEVDQKGALDVADLRFQADIQMGLDLYADASASLLLALKQLGPGKGDIRVRGSVLQTLSRSEIKEGKLKEAAAHLEESIRCEQSERGDGHHTLIAREIEVSRIYVRLGRVEDALRSTGMAVAIARETGNDEKLPKTLRAAGEIREKAGQFQAALAFRRECMSLERQHNTDRGKWMYELSEIARLQSIMGLHDAAEKSCVELWKGIQSEPQVYEDEDFLKSLCTILVETCGQWQKATGNTAHAANIERWRAIALGQASFLP